MSLIGKYDHIVVLSPVGVARAARSGCLARALPVHTRTWVVAVMDIRGDGVTDETLADTDGGTWMTYDELAAARGIDRISAVKLALRNAWRKQRDKYRVARVRVPPEWLGSNQATGPGAGFHTGPYSSLRTNGYGTDETQVRETEAQRSGQVRAAEWSTWQRRLAEERERADKAEQEVAHLLTVIDGLEGRIVGAETRADQAQEALAVERSRAESAEQALSAERANADWTGCSLDAYGAECGQDSEGSAGDRSAAEIQDAALATQRARAERATNEALAAHRTLASLADKALVEARARVASAEEALAAERTRTNATRVWIEKLGELVAAAPGDATGEGTGEWREADCG